MMSVVEHVPGSGLLTPRKEERKGVRKGRTLWRGTHVTVGMLRRVWALLGSLVVVSVEFGFQHFYFSGYISTMS